MRLVRCTTFMFNSVGEPSAQKGLPYPKGTMFLIDLHDFALVDGAYMEGPLKGLPLMIKDGKKYPRLVAGDFNSWAAGDPEADRDRFQQTMLRMPPAKKSSGLRLFNLHPVAHWPARERGFH